MTRPPKTCALEGCVLLVPSGSHKYCTVAHRKEAGKEAARQRARAANMPHPRHRPAERICLGCGRPFPSDGPWNRKCDKCKKLPVGSVTPGQAYRVSPDDNEDGLSFPKDNVVRNPT